MRNYRGIGASVVALSAALASSSFGGVIGPAHVFVVNSIADYNAAQVKSANGILTVPPGLATYTVNQGSLEINSRFTVTLPGNFTFSSQPSLSDTGSTAFTLASGGIGSQSATFVVGPQPLTAGQSATLNSFAIQGTTALETPVPLALALPITAQSTANAIITNNDPSPLTAGAFASEPGVAAQFTGNFSFIDLTPPSFGSQFVVDGTDSPTAPIATLTGISAETSVPSSSPLVPVLGPNGVTNVLSSDDTATVTVQGFFSGIKAAFASSTVDCLTPVSAGLAGPGVVTFAGVPSNLPVSLCVTANSGALLQQNLQGFTSVTIAPGISTDFLAGGATIEDVGRIAYTGGGIVSVTNFFTGDDAGYSSLLRVNNSGSVSVDVFALVEPDTGGPALTGSLGSLGAGIGTVFTEPQLAAAIPALNLANSGQRATVDLIVTGNFRAVAASSFLVNPTGVVTNVGVQQNVVATPPV